MNAFPNSRLPTVICKDENDRGNARVVALRPQEWLSNDYLSTSSKPNDSCVMLAPMNTNINFNALDRRARYRTLETYDNDTESATNAPGPGNFVVPPLNTDIRFSSILPYHTPTLAINAAQFDAEHPHKPHVHQYNATNFSWALPSSEDTAEIAAKKKLIHPIQNQRLCGSCWAVSTAAAISDCFVVSGAVNWSPRISPTYIMMCLPQKPEIQQQCNGGNPAEVALALETTGVCDTTCIDYSWCSNDADICTSAEAAAHFQSTLGDRLNANIPTPCGCYFAGEKLSYKLDSGSDVWGINAANNNIDVFRKSVYAHLVDFGPTIGGFVVLRNFTTGNFTDPAVNGGVYLDRADYTSVAPGRPLKFDDSFTTDVVGLHAVSVIGWGTAKNVQYDVDKIGDVPYWHCRNSWGQNWGKEMGYFKIAMYPFNKISQFCTQVNLPQGGPIGSMILMRATKPPGKVQMNAISNAYLSAIKRTNGDAYYKQTPDDIEKTAPASGPVSAPTVRTVNYQPMIVGAIVVAVLGFLLWKLAKFSRPSAATPQPATAKA